MSCSMMISVIEGSSASSRSVSAMRSPRDSPEAGSSSIISCGSLVCAMPTSSWRCSPCESEPTVAEILLASPTDAASSRARSRIGSSRPRETIGRKCPRFTPSTPRYRLSSTVSPWNSRDFWYVRDIPSFVTYAGGYPVVSWPRNSIVPELAATSRTACSPP